MEAPEVAALARNYAVMVRIQGPDPKGLKMRRQAFHLHRDGTTTLSASGLLLQNSLTDSLPLLEQLRQEEGVERLQLGAVVVTTASIVEPFLPSRGSEAVTKVFRPEMIPGAHIDVLTDRGEMGALGSESSTSHDSWRGAKLLALVDVATASSVLGSLLSNNGSLDNGSWDIGWSLPPSNNENNPSSDVPSNEGPPVLLLKDISQIRIAFLEVSKVDIKDIPNINVSLPHIGDSVLAMGSPFGILSPSHFFNTICSGAVANCLPAGASHAVLLMADIRCLPGMDGGPVFDKHGNLVGLLIKPLKQKGSSIEIQIVITWDSVVSSLQLSEVQSIHEVHDFYSKHTRRNLLSWSKFHREIETPKNLPNHAGGLQVPAEKAVSSVVLITVGDGAWASGILLNSSGLVLTNAHLLEPWRFGRTSLLGMSNEKDADESKDKVYPVKSNYRSYHVIRVRLNHKKPWVWSNAQVVYVSKGPIDIALLQLESVVEQLVPVNVNYDIPAQGSPVHVIGHGPFGPRSDTRPYVSSGAIAKVIKCPCSIPLFVWSSLSKTGGNLPVMLKTTAAVYPGMSGGAVVSSDGKMIALVTSNAKHGGGKIIPEMNFSIPCAVLEPVFLFSVKGNISLLRIYDSSDPYVSSVWALKPPLLSEPKSRPEIKDGKGSRFAEFLAKTQDGTTLADKGLNMKGKVFTNKRFHSKM